MKKRFVAPVLREEASLALMTQGLVSSPTDGTSEP